MGDKKVVFVSQGTIAMNPTEFLISIMAALEGGEEVTVVFALGKPGATLAEGTLVQANARVEECIPYDDILEHTDLFITSGGYGSLQHSLSNGVPLIVGGEGADKPENAMRVEFAGAGIDLKSTRPSELALLEAVMTVLNDSEHKKSWEIQWEMESYDPIEVVVTNIEEAASGEKA